MRLKNWAKQWAGGAGVLYLLIIEELAGTASLDTERFVSREDFVTCKTNEVLVVLDEPVSKGITKLYDGLEGGRWGRKLNYWTTIFLVGPQSVQPGVGKHQEFHTTTGCQSANVRSLPSCM